MVASDLRGYGDSDKPPMGIRALASLDVVPLQAAFDYMDSQLAFAWFPWHLMRQPSPFPKTMIGNNARFYLDFLLERGCVMDGWITEDAYNQHLRCFNDLDTIRAICLDYRAIGIDLKHGEADRGRKLTCPVFVLWGDNMAKPAGWQTGAGLDMLTVWRERAVDLRGRAFDCGHFLPEERPAETIAELLTFLSESESI